jgi:hypothetical protein
VRVHPVSDSVIISFILSFLHIFIPRALAVILPLGIHPFPASVTCIPCPVSPLHGDAIFTICSETVESARSGLGFTHSSQSLRLACPLQPWGATFADITNHSIVFVPNSASFSLPFSSYSRLILPLISPHSAHPQHSLSYTSTHH